MGKAGIGDVDCFCSEELSHEAVDGEGVPGGDYLIAGGKERMAEEFDDFVRSIAEDHILAGETEFFSDCIAEGPGAAIGIKVRTLQGVPHCLKRFWGWAEGIFVRGELDDLVWFEAHFTGEFLNRFARFVGDQVQHMGVGSRRHGG